MAHLKYLVTGLVFGFILTKAEVISWFRIQEMFRFHDIHMYGVIGSAVFIGIISIQIIKRFNVKDIHGEDIRIAPKDSTQMKRYVIGGLIFGFGWALTGACPGPLFALLGSGITIFIVPILAALAGTWTYGAFREKLPH
ncbi:YeeE/YedE thiosulfate transporter family protein [Balneolaceae bacterium ANBcel3]|nr:YeeE/YedE thiosulfate transporter family protein [Balneolaceae bacterium ANBcel3]